MKPLGETPLIIYTDGSGIEDRIGVAALVNATGEHRHSQMGSDEVSTVYSTKLRGTKMALELAEELKHDDRVKNGVVVFSDSQAALKTLLPTANAIRTDVSLGVHQVPLTPPKC